MGDVGQLRCRWKLSIIGLVAYFDFEFMGGDERQKAVRGKERLVLLHSVKRCCCEPFALSSFCLLQISKKPLNRNEDGKKRRAIGNQQASPVLVYWNNCERYHVAGTRVPVRPSRGRRKENDEILSSTAHLVKIAPYKLRRKYLHTECVAVRGNDLMGRTGQASANAPIRMNAPVQNRLAASPCLVDTSTICGGSCHDTVGVERGLMAEAVRPLPYPVPWSWGHFQSFAVVFRIRVRWSQRLLRTSSH